MSEQIYLLLRNHLELYHEFCNFLPNCATIPSGNISPLPQYSIDSPPPSTEFSKLSLDFIAPQIPNSPPVTPTVRPSFKDARYFVKAVKETFSHNPIVYEQFLQVLHEYHQNKLDHLTLFEFANLITAAEIQLM